MPFKSKNKDREWHRETMRRRRSVTPKLLHPVTPIQGLVMKGNIIMGVQPKLPIVPLYNPSIHKPGDKVRMLSPFKNKLIEVVIPELDADGNPY